MADDPVTSQTSMLIDLLSGKGPPAETPETFSDYKQRLKVDPKPVDEIVHDQIQRFAAPLQADMAMFKEQVFEAVVSDEIGAAQFLAGVVRKIQSILDSGITYLKSAECRAMFEMEWRNAVETAREHADFAPPEPARAWSPPSDPFETAQFLEHFVGPGSTLHRNLKWVRLSRELSAEQIRRWHKHKTGESHSVAAITKAIQRTKAKLVRMYSSS